MKPRLYSRLAIGLCALFLTPFFGSILFAANMNETDRGKFSYYFVIGGVCWYSIIDLLIGRLFLPTSFFPFIIANVLGSIVLCYPLWHRFFGQYEHYEIRSVEKPVALFVSFCIVICWLLWLLAKNWAAA